MKIAEPPASFPFQARPSSCKVVTALRKVKSKAENNSGTVVTVGRHHDNSIVFDDELISDRHAQIMDEGGDFILSGTSIQQKYCGTWVNGKRVTFDAAQEWGTSSPSAPMHSPLCFPRREIRPRLKPGRKSICRRCPGRKKFPGNPRNRFPQTWSPFPEQGKPGGTRRHCERQAAPLKDLAVAAPDIEPAGRSRISLCRYRGRPSARRRSRLARSAWLLRRSIFTVHGRRTWHAYEAGYAYGLE